MNKSKLLKTTVAIVALAALVTGGYVYKAAIYDKLQHKITVRSRTIMWQSDGTQLDESVLEK